MTVFERTLAFLNRNERLLMIVTTICGFSFDIIIAKRPDSLFVNVLLLVYICVSAAIIVHLHTPARRSGVKHPAETLLFLLVLTFCFGGLASNLLILYGKSGTPSGDLLFIGLLLGLLVGNEFVRGKYEQFRFNIGVWYTLLLTYCVIAVPTFVLHTIGASEFLMSEGISLAAAIVFLLILNGVVKLFKGTQGRQLLRQSIYIILSIFYFFNALYFFGVIPPVPLALKQIGVYHSVIHMGDSYLVVLESPKTWEFWKDTSTTFHSVGNEPLYCFSAVFAPTELTTPIVHRIEHYNEVLKAWDTITTVSFPILGGRAEGFRGYSVVASPKVGKWRCDVETSGGNLIGRTNFTVEEGSAAPVLVQSTL